MCHILKHAAESVKVLLTDGEPTILTKDSEVEDVEDLLICSEKVRLRRCRWQLLQVQGHSDAHTTERILWRVFV